MIFFLQCDSMQIVKHAKHNYNKTKLEDGTPNQRTFLQYNRNITDSRYACYTSLSFSQSRMTFFCSFILYDWTPTLGSRYRLTKFNQNSSSLIDKFKNKPKKIHESRRNYWNMKKKNFVACTRKKYIEHSGS